MKYWVTKMSLEDLTIEDVIKESGKVITPEFLEKAKATLKHTLSSDDYRDLGKEESANAILLLVEYHLYLDKFRGKMAKGDQFAGIS
jgi:hypothetical protein